MPDQNQNQKPDSDAEQVALSRYLVIAELCHLTPGTPEYCEEMSRLLAKEWNLFGTNRTHVVRQTIRDWLRRCDSAVGIASLYPNPAAIKASGVGCRLKRSRFC